jgi:O-antigen/teichoic acid export membrane protein
MKEIQVVSRNSFMLAFREVILKLAGLITFPIIARAIGVSVLGVLGTAEAFAGILFLVADLGLNKSLIKEVAQVKGGGNVIFSNGVVLKTASMLGAFLIGLFVMRSSGLDEVSMKLGILVLLLAFLHGFYELIKSMFSAYERMEFLPLLDGMAKVCTLIVVILIFLVFQGSIIDFQITSLFITIGITALSWKLFNERVHRIRFKLQIGMIGDLLKMSIPFMMVGLFAQTFGAIDSLMLAAMLGKDAVGLYQVAYKFVVFSQFIPATITAALFPTLSRLFVEDYSKFEYGLKRCFKYLYILSIPLAMSLHLMAPFIVEVVFGRDYMGSVPLLQVLTWTLVFIFLTFPLGVSLGVSGKQKYNVIAVICGSTGNIIMNYIFIGFWGVYGVAISTVLTAGLIFGCSIYFFRRIFNEISLVENRMWFPSVSLIVFIVVQYILSLEGLSLVLLFNGIFFGTALLFRTIDREDRAILSAILKIS